MILGCSLLISKKTASPPLSPNYFSMRMSRLTVKVRDKRILLLFF